MPDTPPIFRKIDCLQVPVPDLEAGLAFYRDRLGHELIWRTDTQAGLRMPDADAELVLQTERPEPEVDLLVRSADDAAAALTAAGGSVLVPPFDIRIGRCAVVADPFGNRLVLLDMTKGRLITDAAGHVLPRAAPDENPWDANADAFVAWQEERYGATPESSPLIEAILACLGDVADRDVLDAACGAGLLARVLARRGARVTGVDVSPRLIEIARQRGPETIDYRLADLTRPIPDLAGRFDAIGSHLALNDVPDHRGFAATLASVLRPGGRLALAFNNPYSAVVREHVGDYFDTATRPVYAGMSSRLGAEIPYHHRTLEEYLDAFLATSLRLIRLVDVREGRPFPNFMVLAFQKP